MNGNYIVKNLKSYFKKKEHFVWFITIVLFMINWYMVKGFFEMAEGKRFSEIFTLKPIMSQQELDAKEQESKTKQDTTTQTKREIKTPLDSLTKKVNLDKGYRFSSELLFLIKLYYWAAAFIAIRGYGVYLYEYFIKDSTLKGDKISEDDVMTPKFPYDQDKLQLIIGLKHKEDGEGLVERPTWVTVPEKGMYQDFLVIGGKGTGKTASCMYPFTKQMMYYKAYDAASKAGMLILDVKGNYTKQALQYANEVNRGNDVIVMNLSGKYKYNPLHKPSLKTQVIANRLRTILELFSTQNADSYWLDKAEVLLNEAIKLVRLYNKGYVTFVEVHKVVNNDEYLNEKIEYMQELEDRNKLTREEKADLRTVKDYFLHEYKTLDTKISSVIKSEVTRMTYTFVSDPQILNTFCAPEDKLNFFGFDDLVDTGKIVVLDMNIAEYRMLSKIIAAYLKLDFQSAALIRLTREGSNRTRPLIFISDEYQEYVTASDADFYAVSREAKCVNIVSTQSYSSLLKTLKSEESLSTILTNLTNKLWLRTDDKKTAESAVAQCGTVDKEEISKSFSESAGHKYNNWMAKSKKQNTNFTENLNVSIKTTDKFKIATFTVNLPIFKAIAYLSDGEKIITPSFVHLQPYFQEIYTNLKGKPAPNGSNNAEAPVAPKPSVQTQASQIVIEDNYDFDSNRVIKEKLNKAASKVYDTKEDEIEKDDDIDDFGFDDYDAKPAKKPEKKVDDFVPNYLDKEVEENLKKIDGIFDED